MANQAVLTSQDTHVDRAGRTLIRDTFDDAGITLSVRRCLNLIPPLAHLYASVSPSLHPFVSPSSPPPVPPSRRMCIPPPSVRLSLSTSLLYFVSALPRTSR